MNTVGIAIIKLLNQASLIEIIEGNIECTKILWMTRQDTVGIEAKEILDFIG